VADDAGEEGWASVLAVVFYCPSLDASVVDSVVADGVDDWACVCEFVFEGLS